MAQWCVYHLLILHLFFWGHNHTTVMQLFRTVKETSRIHPIYGYLVVETSNPAHNFPPKPTCYVAQIHPCWPEYEHQHRMQLILTRAYITTLQFCDNLYANKDLNYSCIYSILHPCMHVHTDTLNCIVPDNNICSKLSWQNTSCVDCNQCFRSSKVTLIDF